MAISETFRAFLEDQLRGLADLKFRPMFGGLGIYADGLFFAIADDDALYFKADAGNLATFARHSMKAFQPFPNRPATMQYYEVPAAALEDREVLRGWAQAALAAARRAQAKRKRAPAPGAASSRKSKGS
jgi:DNA transformation protein